MDFGSVLKDLCSQTGVSGSEKELSVFISHLFEIFCDSVEIDPFFNVIGIKRGFGSSKKRILVMAHADEIGFLVKSIDDRGFIRFTNIGGMDSKILLAQEVVIHGRERLPGIIGAKPPHLLKPEETKKAVKLDELAIDTGMDAVQVKKLISIGDLITLKTVPLELQGGKFSSKALDNRSGVAVLLRTMENICSVKHENDVYFIANTQEEVGSRGAIIASYNALPDAAVVIDACHGDMPDAPKDEIFTLGKGPAVAIGPNLHRKMTNRLIETAKEGNIPYQTDVEPGDTGTDAWFTQVSRSGIPTVLISVPVRYMHTPVETVSLSDIKNAGRLVAEFVSLSTEELEGILCC